MDFLKFIAIPSKSDNCISSKKKTHVKLWVDCTSIVISRIFEIYFSPKPISFYFDHNPTIIRDVQTKISTLKCYFDFAGIQSVSILIYKRKISSSFAVDWELWIHFWKEKQRNLLTRTYDSFSKHALNLHFFYSESDKEILSRVILPLTLFPKN